ncbi:ATP-binding cassette domain-containing protein [Candidatus Berkiella aquae]|uniref:ABC transporter ATP-binding protein/permease n=1 Tax=Candidatus Berkiella aquae TaxID=295108 RepID=A0A0Q9YPI1_9GAMM|nr:ABC transporter ATP-binding protein [Candidatus Berkiella aquae]MCS5709899.1 ABC transporter ATP-binding protein/permease [Candidatus Berkiella aquae]
MYFEHFLKNPYFSLIAAVWHYGASMRKAIIGYYIAYVLAQGALSLSPYAFGRAIDVLQHFEAHQLNQVIYWLVFGVAVLLIFWAFHGPARVIERKVALKIQQSLRSNLYEQLTHLPLKWHHDHHSGNTITRINRASTALHRFAENQFIYIETIVRFVASISFLLWISLPVGLISLFSSMIVIAIVFLFDKRLIPLYAAENDVENKVGAVIFDYISNMTTVLTLRLGELTHNNLLTRMSMIWPFFHKENVLNEIKWFTMMNSLSIIQAIILITYIVQNLHTNNAIMIGLVVMIFRYQWELNSVFQDLSYHCGEIVRMNTDISSIDPILTDIKQLAHLPQGAKTARLWHTLEINHLTFAHASTPRQAKIFDQIAFNIKRGEKIALIGKSGGGKSTLLNLLCSLYTPNHVSLKIDGIDFDTLEPLQAITTLIPQDPELFENTILFNITMDLPASHRDIQQVVKLARFGNVLETLPQGLDTDIREKGLNLSVGQKQRLALARGLFAARFSSLLLMDEPTSSVDLPTEKDILSGVIEAFPETAMLVSLHRLHLLPKFDSIIMLSDGKVIANGPTTQLLNTPGPVRDLWLSYLQE